MVLSCRVELRKGKLGRKWDGGLPPLPDDLDNDDDGDDQGMNA